MLTIEQSTLHVVLEWSGVVLNGSNGASMGGMWCLKYLHNAFGGF